MVTTAAQADFELRLYELPSEEVTLDSIMELFGQVGKEWGIDYVGGFNKQGLLTTLHFYIEPTYMLSYSISNDVALQAYELKMQKAGAGLRSPFEPGSVEKSRDTFTQLLEQ